MTLTTWLTQAPLVSASVWVTVPLLRVSAPVGAPVAAVLVSPGHSTVALAGKLTKVGAVVSLTVMVWAQFAMLPAASVAVQVRVMVLTTLFTQLPRTSASLCVMAGVPPQLSVAVALPVLLGSVEEPHSTIAAE